MCVDGNLETMCTTNRKAYSSITLDFGEPVEIAKVIAHKDHRCLIENWKNDGEKQSFFAGQSCSKLQTPKDVFSKDCHRQRDCAKWITCKWRYWSCYSFSKVFSSGFEVEGYDTQLMSISPEFQAVGQYLIIQRDQSVGGRNAALSAIEVIAYCPGSNVPNSPEKPSEGDLEPGAPGFPHTLILLPRGLKLPRRQGPCPFFNHNVEPQEAKTWGRQVHRWEQRDRLHDQEWALPLHNFGLWPPSGYSSGHFS